MILVTCSGASSADIDAEEELPSFPKGVRLAVDELALANRRGGPHKRRRFHHVLRPGGVNSRRDH
jgi:hypothetical protein